MIPPFEIFRVEDGEPVWIGLAQTLEAAKSRVRSDGAKWPGEYLIVSLQTRHKESITVRPERAGSA